MLSRQLFFFALTHLQDKCPNFPKVRLERRKSSRFPPILTSIASKRTSTAALRTSTDSSSPFPRRLSDNEFQAAAPPPEWVRYMRHNGGFTFDFNMTTVASELFCVEKRDGSYTQLFKYDENVSRTPFDSRLEAIAEIDAREFKSC
ncbi:hypothetical protein C8R47DRAFT_1205178 [Mycena vitilis]|nr:hypothetical protein C8R47DRAFT_1205178 [Mycena vitilis]